MENAFKDANSSGVRSAIDSLNPLKDFKKVGKIGKTVKGAATIGVAFNVGDNIKTNFFDDTSSSLKEKIRNFTVDQGVDTVSGMGAAYAGAAIGTMIGGPVGTFAGALIGMGMSVLMNYEWSNKESSSIVGGTKEQLKEWTNGLVK